jgi:hypothetical protein
MPISRDFKGGGYASGGPPFKKLLTSAALFTRAHNRISGRENLGRDGA